RPIFEREYNKVKTFLKPDRDEEPTKKRGVEETLLLESFKKLRAEVEVSGSYSTQDTQTDDPKEMSEEYFKNMLQIIPIQDDLGAKLQGKLEEKDKVNAATKEVNAAEPTVFDDEEVTMTMAQTLIKMKAKKARLLDEKMAKRIGKGFSGVETPLFATMLVQPQADTEEKDEEDEVHAAPTPPSPTHEPTPPSQEPITSPP
nr:hypothetical protein [Tanacetum cinerariifolium]